MIIFCKFAIGPPKSSNALVQTTMQSILLESLVRSQSPPLIIKLQYSHSCLALRKFTSLAVSHSNLLISYTLRTLYKWNHRGPKHFYIKYCISLKHVTSTIFSPNFVTMLLERQVQSYSFLSRITSQPRTPIAVYTVCNCRCK